jgi:hypothetical protein
MPQANEIDELKQKVVRNHLSRLSQAPKPEQETGQFVIDRGYLTPDGKSTPLGKEFLTLVDAGLMDENGEITPEGKVYSMTEKDAVYGSFEDFAKREKLGLNKLDEDALDKPSALEAIGSTVKDFFTKSVPAMYRVTQPTALLDPLKYTNDVASLAKGSLLSLEPLATGAVYKGAELLMPLQSGNESEKEMASLMMKQEYKKKRYDYDSIKGADLLTALTLGSTAPTQMRQALIKRDGEEKVLADEQALELGGSIALDPTMLASMGITTVAKGVGQTMSRAILNAEKSALKATVLATEQAGIKAQKAALEAALSKAEATGVSVAERANALKSIGKTDEAIRYEATSTRIGDRINEIKAKIDELAEIDARISNDIVGLSKKAGVGDALLAMDQKIKQFNALPANVTGQVFEKIGDTLIKTDAWLDDVATRTGVSGFYDAMKSIPGVSAGLLLGPAAAIPTVTARVFASGPFMESVGRFTKILGKELIQERGSVPYWRRVANNPTISNAQKFLAHRMDELTLGGRVPEMAGKIAKGTAVSYPLNLGIEYLQDPYAKPEDLLGRAGAASFVFGGGSMGAGAMFKGSAQRLKETRINDEINFTRNLLESQKSGFNSLSKGARRSVATYAAVFPNLNFDFVENIPSRYDPATNTIQINTKSNNPMRPLIAHEVMHYTTIRNQITPVIHSMLLGDSETPGILRKTDGTLDPDFQRFKDAYDARTDAANIERRTIQDIAEEYFIENTVDSLVSMVETGELSKMAGKTQAGRQLQKFIDAAVPKVPVLKDLFFRTGGAMGAGGRYVVGNGILADGIKELPEAKAIMRNLIRETAGEASSIKTRKGISGEDAPNLQVKKGDPIVDSFHSIFETDANGKPLLDKDGNHIALSKAIDDARSAAGFIITEEQIKRVNEGYMPEDGEIKLIPDKGWFGRFISTPVINALAARGILNSKQIAILRNINTATRINQGTRYMVINHPATIKGRGGKVKYASLGATLRETVPVGFSITQKGNILVHLMSVDQLSKNIAARASSKRGQSLYQGNTEAIKKDISAVMDLHASNTKTDKYFQDKYGARWEEHQQFINTIFGLMTKEQRDINPMFEADKIKDGNVYRTYRLDRISKATKMDGTPIPFNYDYIKVNYLADGVPEKASNSQMMPEPDYRGQHTAPDSDGGAPLHDMKDIYPDDIYSNKAAQYYGHWGDYRDNAAIKVIQSMRGKPNAPVKIYRAVPKEAGDNINKGDWVTTVRSYATDHGEGALMGEYKILEKIVKAKDIFTNGDSIFEFGYSPED